LPCSTVHIVHSFPPASFGGVETYVAMLAFELSARGHRVRVVAGSAAPQAVLTREPRSDLEVWRLPGATDTVADGSSATIRRLLEHWLAADPPDLVHVHHWQNVTSDLIEIARSLGLASVVTLHDFFSTCALCHRLSDGEHPCAAELEHDVCVRCLGKVIDWAPVRIDRELLRREQRFRRELELAQARVAISETQREYLARVPLLERLELVTLPLPRPSLPAVESRAAPRDPGCDLRIVSWGGLDPGKGMETLIRAADSLAHAERVSVDHFGRVLDESFRGRLDVLATRVRWRSHGAFPREFLWQRFPHYDLAVFPSLYLETHGFVVDEALAVGLPVIVSDRGAPAARIGGRGRTFPGGDWRSLARLLEELASDPRRLAAMRSAPLPHAPTLREHVAQIESVYARVLRSEQS
jgi:glycosyltransferase involved in cell wall biosynthesis